MNVIDIVNLLKGALNFKKKMDTKILPSQGLFYKDDFILSIKKASTEDIIEYEHNYTKDNIGIIIQKLKKIVEKNTILSNNYIFSDIKSIDIVFLFLEIVKFTKGKSISIKYFDEDSGSESDIEFGPLYFNYFEPNMNLYNKDEKIFDVDEYKFSLPSIGIENCVTNFLISKSNTPGYDKYNNYNYDFTYFLGDKKSINFSEIDNLIQVFNYDIAESELRKVKKVISIFQPIQKYSLRKGYRIIEINSKIDLENIWK